MSAEHTHAHTHTQYYYIAWAGFELVILLIQRVGTTTPNLHARLQ